ncbi:MAG TPA: methyl-accepting chemotaxis protein [Candidatus Sulfotelmatobacter sp.]|jgi:methyl-accepting chemotaxis protein|nr:methyl-accepting chemotaxis protein [Candidatus Sulfotelmatobacter sp.]
MNVSIGRGLKLRQRFMIFIGLGLTALVALAVLVIAGYEQESMERKLNALSVNEMTSLHALIVNVMAKRPEDPDNIGVTVFNNWFDSRNVNYPGKVWSVWSPKVTDYMHDAEPERKPKSAQDDIDREVLSTGKPVGRMVDGFYRYSMPIVLGVTDGAKSEVCHSCHGAMGLTDGEVIAVLSSSLSVAQEREHLTNVILALALGGLAAAVAAVLGVRWSLGKIITTPIGSMIGTMERLADGDTSVDVTFLDRRDEMGDMARTVKIFKDHMIEADRLRLSQEQERRSSARERAEALRVMADRFESTIKTKVAEVEEATSGIGSTAGSMASRSERSGGRSLEVGRAAKITTERSASAASATNQLSASVHNVADRAHQSTDIARTAVADVNATALRMDELSQAVQSIGDVVNLINDIASQTNLLALNATIEAARAGEAGKGFAVVAGEVKNLANQTAKATDEISSQVSAVQLSTREMRESISRVVDTIRTMDQNSTEISQAVAEQNSATQGISNDINEVAVQASDVSNSVAHLAKTSAMACAGTVRVMWSAKRLTSVVEDLRIEAEQFLISVREAGKNEEG